MFDDVKTDVMEQAKLLQSNQAQGDVVVQNEVLPAAGAVFAEPIVTAQPCRIRRDVTQFLSRMKTLAAMAGEEYRYSFPVKNKDGSTKSIEGGSIKLANDLVREYGNCMVDVRVVDQQGYYIFYARFIDFETGFCMTRSLRQRKGQQTIKTDSERQEDIVFQIGQSKAIRNVVLNALQTFADFTYDEAKKSLVNQIGRDIAGWRGKMQAGIGERGFDLKRIEASLGKAIGEWLAPDIARVMAELKAVKDGLAHFDDVYPDQSKAKANDPKSLQNEFAGDAAVGAAKQAINPTVAPAQESGQTQHAQEPIAAPASLAFDAKDKASCEAAVMPLYKALEATPKEERGAKFLQLDGMELIAALQEHKSSAMSQAYLERLGVKLPQPNLI